MPTGVYKRARDTLQKRLMHRVVKTDSCWLWTGSKQPSGHGQIANGNFKPELNKRTLLQAHRASYELFFGAIPTGMCVCHKCDVPNCVNPEHLFLGTKADNSRDMVQKGRQKRGADLPQAKLSEEEVREIRASNLSYRKLAAKFGIAVSAAYYIKTCARWSHLS